MKRYTRGRRTYYSKKSYGYRPAQGRSRHDAGDILRTVFTSRIFWTAVIAAIVVIVVLVVLFYTGVLTGSGNTDQGTATVQQTETAESAVQTDEETSQETETVTSAEPDFEKYAGAETLKEGSEGDDVTALQTRLCELGYLDENNITGSFGRFTRIGVMDFQKQNDLQYDGIAGPETQAYIYWDGAKQYEFEFYDAAPTVLMTFTELVGDDGSYDVPEEYPPANRYKLIVDIEKQTLIAYTADSTGTYTVPARYMLCSVGTDVQAGTFSMGEKRVRFSFFESDGIYRQYWSQVGNASTFITSIGYKDDDASTYIEDSYSSLGTATDGGSITLTVPDARWIWYNVAPGSQIVIRYGAEDDVATAEIREQLVLTEIPKSRVEITPGQIPNTDNWYIGGVDTGDEDEKL